MSKAVAKKGETNEIVAFDPSLFEQDAGLGMGDLSQDDMAIPFLKVLSRQDPTLDDLDDAKAGDILNTVSNQVYAGKGGIRVIPCAYQRRYIEWAPRGSGNGAPLNIYTPEDQRPRTERADDNKDYVVTGNGSYIEETHQHYVLILNEDGTTTTAVIAMKSTQMKKSRKWNSTIAQRTLMGKNGPFTPPRFSHVYLLRTVSEENSKGSWHGWDITLEGVVEDPSQYTQAKAFSESIQKGDVEAKHTSEGDDTSNDAPF
jgi:hypothetical protein|tara:strand:- start:2235 stop:3008 length:774 start_codon:yes stop_codon:yes gene_type:complete